MRIIIRSSDHGLRLPAAQVEEKKKAAREKILEAGMHYLEYQAILGSFDVGGHEIQEEVTIIEPVTESNYV